MNVGVRTVQPLNALFIRRLGLSPLGDEGEEGTADEVLEEKAARLLKSGYDIAIAGPNEKPARSLGGVPVVPPERFQTYALYSARSASHDLRGLVKVAAQLEEAIVQETGVSPLRFYDLIEAHDADAAMVAAILEQRRNQQLAANGLTTCFAVLSQAVPASIGHCHSPSEKKFIRDFGRVRRECLAAWEAALSASAGRAGWDPLEAAKLIGERMGIPFQNRREGFLATVVRLNLLGADEVTIRKLRMAASGGDAWVVPGERVHKVVWHLHGRARISPGARKAAPAAKDPSEWDLLRRFLLFGGPDAPADDAEQMMLEAMARLGISVCLRPPDAIVAGAKMVRQLERRFGRRLAMPAITVDPLKDMAAYLSAVERIVASGSGMFDSGE